MLNFEYFQTKYFQILSFSVKSENLNLLDLFIKIVLNQDD
jgi:hypothetical protein